MDLRDKLIQQKFLSLDLSTEVSKRLISGIFSRYFSRYDDLSLR